MALDVPSSESLCGNFGVHGWETKVNFSGCREGEHLAMISSG